MFLRAGLRRERRRGRLSWRGRGCCDEWGERCIIVRGKNGEGQGGQNGVWRSHAESIPTVIRRRRIKDIQAQGRLLPIPDIQP